MRSEKLVTAVDAVILANGDFPTTKLPLQLLREAHHVVACDGAVRHWPQADAIIGDGDSISAEYRHRLIQVDEQDDNDLTKATRYCMAQGWRRIAYVGCTGRREDHTMGNIALLMRYHREFHLDVLMATDHGWFVPATGPQTFCSLPGQQVSIFNFGCTRLQSTGLKWQAYPYQQLWQGTLNEALGSKFTIEADGNYLIYRTY
jgi:thiamine pyrophosphokinase